MKRIVIYHFNPIELYPPILNFIENLAKEFDENTLIDIYTNFPDKKITLFVIRDSRVRIFRYKAATISRSHIIRFYHYLGYHFNSFFCSIKRRFDVIIYFESISAGVPWLLNFCTFTKKPLFIHFHEYMTPDEYKKGSYLYFILHKLELPLLKTANWVSHTNLDRMNLFLKDLGDGIIKHPYIMSNYPPMSWTELRRRQIHDNPMPLKIVYVGALDLNSMYIPEFAEWIESNNGKIIWDIYSLQNADELELFLESIDAKFISFKGHVTYNQLPIILSEYNIGVILYKGHMPNFIYNAPNKLFEYLALGLDVWFPNTLLGAMPYTRKDTSPKVLALDFSLTSEWNLSHLVANQFNKSSISNYYAEEENQKMIDLIKSELIHKNYL